MKFWLRCSWFWSHSELLDGLTDDFVGRKVNSGFFGHTEAGSTGQECSNERGPKQAEHLSRHITGAHLSAGLWSTDRTFGSWPSSPNSLNPPAGDQTFLLLGRRTLCLILLSDYTILKQHQVFFNRYRGSVLGEIFNFRCFCFLWHCTWEFLTFFMHFLNTAEQIPSDFLFSGLFSGTWFKFHRLEWEQAERSQTYRFRVTSVAQSLKMK